MGSNWPRHHQGYDTGPNQYAMPRYRAPSPIQEKRNNPQTLQNPKFVENTSYHISTIGDEGEEVIEESATCEDGYQIYHSTKYKKRMKRLEKMRQKMWKIWN